MLDDLTAFVTVFLALSIASERLVEIIKGLSKDLTGQKSNPNAERWRQWGIHTISLVASAVVVLLMHDYIASSLKITFDLREQWYLVIAFAILASGGSSMWNSILSYLLSLKDLKRQDVAVAQNTGKTNPSKLLPVAMPQI